MKPLLDARNISKSFGALKAVDDVSFHAFPGEVFGIAGPNGSGKSTLFNTLTGIPFPPDHGEVFLEGASIRSLGSHEIARRGLLRTFQRETAFSSLTVKENIQIAELHAVPSPQQREDVETHLRFCGIPEDDWLRPADVVSVFTKKKMMIASALVMHPKVILMDEPASGLTEPEINETEEIIRRIVGRGITVVLIEHILALLLGVSDRLMVLNEGKEITTGLPDDVIRDRRVIHTYLGGEAGG